MEAAAVIFALAGLGGIAMATMRLNGQPYPPTWMAMGHGAVAAAGVAWLGYTAATVSLPMLANVALGLFVLAALGGITMFALFHLQSKQLPIPLVLGHGGIAVAGLVCLLLAMFA